MGWVKGHKMSEAHKQAISRARQGMKFTQAHRDNIAAVRRGTTSSESTRQKLSVIARQNAADPEWRRKVSEGTIANYNHASQKAGVRRELRRRGIRSFFTGGQGHPEPRPYTAEYARLLMPLGYVPEYQMQWSKTVRYRLDFAHPQAMVNIEIDGSVHRHPARQEKDRLRDERLRSKGWRVIRVREW